MESDQGVDSGSTMRNKREKLLLTVALLAVAILAGDRLVLDPLIKGWKARAEKIIALDEDLGNGKNLLEREKALKEKWGRYLGGNLNRTNSIAEDEVLRAIETWTDDSRILLTSIKPQWQNHEDRYRTYDVRLVAEGTMQQAVRFVHAIESDELPLKIEQLELASREKTGQLVSVSVRFTGLQLGEALQ